ncbi:MAG: hypothetical protein GF401_07065, partial [Chitinivibrionales bacterium]|nr:hypothetical protein [Chitinivibrionales bacterium]
MKAHKYLFPFLLFIATFVSADTTITYSDYDSLFYDDRSISKSSADCCPFCKITLTDGQSLIGTIIEENDSIVGLRLLSGNSVKLPSNTIEKIQKFKGAQKSYSGKLWLPDPGRTGYFASPSAFMLEKGEFSLSQKELVATVVNYGITDWLSIDAGTFFPFLFAGGGFYYFAGFKVGTGFHEYINLASGMQVFGFADPYHTFYTLIPHLTATFGRADNHLSLSITNVFGATDEGFSSAEMRIFTISGQVRISKRIALITDNGVVGVFSHYWEPVWSLGVKFMGEHISV